jgi:hypothetical protein
MREMLEICGKFFEIMEIRVSESLEFLLQFKFWSCTSLVSCFKITYHLTQYYEEILKFRNLKKKKYFSFTQRYNFLSNYSGKESDISGNPYYLALLSLRENCQDTDRNTGVRELLCSTLEFKRPCFSD